MADVLYKVRRQIPYDEKEVIDIVVNWGLGNPGTAEL